MRLGFIGLGIMGASLAAKRLQGSLKDGNG
jgi:3-hydroxyisobutyrate dehydrogenase-like beta-hydroxyacid dehydrogenase